MHNPEREEIMGYPFQTTGMIHSKEAKGEFTILDKTGDNRYLAKVGEVVCTAIFNPFSGMFYVDDVYGVVNANA